MSDSIISRSEAKNMIDKYQIAPSGSVNPESNELPSLTKFVHFTLADIFDLMKLNGIVTDSDNVGSILQNKINYGIKLYFAQHVNKSDCPNNDAAHIGSNTIVIVNTVEKDFVWYDIPEPNSGIQEIQEYAMESSGQALDKGTKCPPTCQFFSNSL